MKLYQLIFLAFTVSLSSFSMAEEKMDHSQHEQHNKKTGYKSGNSNDELNTLTVVPKSGKSREAGFDDRYAMEPTSAYDKLADLCAKGSRGLIMLDRQTLAKCGGTPNGFPQRHDIKQQEPQTSHQH